MEFKIDEKTVFLVRYEDEVYKFENIHELKTYYKGDFSDGGNYDIYFRSSKIIDNEVKFMSLFLNRVNLDKIKVEGNIYKIECQGVSRLNEWSKKIQLTPKKRVRVTKEIAQQRMDDLGYEFDLIEWNTTAKPATIKCRVCGKEITFKQGHAIYHKPNGTRGFGGFYGVCNHQS